MGCRFLIWLIIFSVSGCHSSHKDTIEQQEGMLIYGIELVAQNAADQKFIELLREQLGVFYSEISSGKIMISKAQMNESANDPRYFSVYEITDKTMDYLIRIENKSSLNGKKNFFNIKIVQPNDRKVVLNGDDFEIHRDSIEQLKRMIVILCYK